MTIPVIFIHDGEQDYLRTALEQAKRWNDEVVLLGIGNEHLWSPWYPWVSERFKDFQAVYQHMNTNSEPFELACFYRWFALRDWMEQQRIDRAWYCDSDVMLYCNVTEWAESVGNPDISLQIPQYQPQNRWSASAHVSLWTLDALGCFCNYVMDMYSDNLYLLTLRQKWEWHRAIGQAGGVCDMTLLFLWSTGDFFRQFSFINNAQVINGATFDHNINTAENYEPGEYWENESGKVIWRGGEEERPAPFYLERGFPPEYIIANALHFQGAWAKARMKDYTA